jgi:hypothetical protein
MCVCGGLCIEVGWGLLLVTIGVLDIFPGHQTKHCQSRLNYFKESLPIACLGSNRIIYSIYETKALQDVE